MRAQIGGFLDARKFCVLVYTVEEKSDSHFNKFPNPKEYIGPKNFVPKKDARFYMTESEIVVLQTDLNKQTDLRNQLREKGLSGEISLKVNLGGVGGRSFDAAAYHVQKMQGLPVPPRGFHEILRFNLDEDGD
jgi:hypothetical protein